MPISAPGRRDCQGLDLTAGHQLGAHGQLDAAVNDFCLLVEAAGVAAQQDLDGLADTLGNLTGRDARVEPGRECGVAQVVGPASRRIR
jgi:hypothetical protein